jgi:YHS domain-containing protein
MKKILIVLFVVTLASCKQKQAEPEAIIAPALVQDTTQQAKPKIELALNEDPVCKMTVGNDYADTTMYNGKIYGFCSPDCKEEFLKNPASYITSK